MTKKEIKTIIKNYNSSLKVVDIDLINNMEFIVARVVCITDFHMVDRISFYNDDTFSVETLYERFNTNIEYKISDYNY